MPQTATANYRLEPYYRRALRFLAVLREQRLGERRHGQRSAATEANAIRLLVDDALRGLSAADKKKWENFQESP